MVSTLEGVAAAFGVSGARRLVPHVHRSSPTWRLDAPGGALLVKRVEVDGRAAEVARAAAFELRVAGAGVRVPTPIAPLTPAVGLATRVNGLGWVRAYEWLDGRPLDPGDDVDAWLGHTMATLHALEPVGAPERIVYGLHPGERWDRWLAAGDRLGRPWARPLRAARGALDEVAGWVAQALDQAGGYVFTHRDIEPWNVLLTPGGPVLLDWDPAGPDCAGLEAGHAAFAFAVESAGTEVDALIRRITAILSAYGAPVPAGDQMFARRVGMRLNRLCWRLQMSTGAEALGPHQLADVDRRAAEQIRVLPAFAAELRRLATAVSTHLA